MDCTCDLCQARSLGCHPLELYFGRDSYAAELVRRFPDKPIYWYENEARLHEKVHSQDALVEIPPD